MKFYDLTPEIRQKINELFGQFNLSQLYQKAACKATRQVVRFTDNETAIEIWQQRLYPDTLPHKTTGTGPIMVGIFIGEDFITYELQNFEEIISWHFPERPLRVIVPSDILADEFMNSFVLKVYANNLDKKSIDGSQFIYFNEADKDSQELLMAYPQIILQIKPE